MAAITPSQILSIHSLIPNLDLLTPTDSTRYHHSIRRWNILAERPCGAIAYPTNTQQISILVQYASVNGLSLAVKGGGHGNRGSSPSSGGICIDLANFAAVHVDESCKGVRVGGGALWSYVYAQAEKYGLAVVGGISPDVGVGGLTIHGGYRWLTGAHGLAVDTVVEIEMVCADGNVLRISQCQHPELWWAMQGAGSCFGVVSEFVLQAFAQRDPVRAENLVLQKSSLSTILRVSEKILARENDKGLAAMCWGWNMLPGKSEPTIWAVPWYNGGEQEGRDFFSKLFDVYPLIEKMRTVPFSQSGTPSGSAPSRDLRKLGHGGSTMAPLDKTFFERLLDGFTTLVSDSEDARKTIVAFEVYSPWKTMAVDQTETAFPNRGLQVNVQVVPTWKNEDNDKLCRTWCSDYTTMIAEEFEKRKASENVNSLTRDSVGMYSIYDGKKVTKDISRRWTDVYTRSKHEPKTIIWGQLPKARKIEEPVRPAKPLL